MTTQSILLWMDGLHLLSHPFLELWLFGMRKVSYIMQFLSLSGAILPLILVSLLFTSGDCKVNTEA
jgi:hypothetical protein